MFSLIITIISIALVAVLALATLYYGSSSFTKAASEAEAAKLVLQGQQVLGAAELYKAANGVWPEDMDALTDEKYLKSIPVASRALGTAYAANQSWEMALPGKPVFVLQGVTTPVCKNVNKRVLGDPYIEEELNTDNIIQCFGPGEDEDLKQMVIAKTTGDLEEALSDAESLLFSGSPPPPPPLPPPLVTYERVSGARITGLGFSDTLVGNTAPGETVVVRNTGTGILELDSPGVTVPARYTVTANDCSGVTLAPLDACSVSLTFSPAAAQYHPGVLSLQTNNPLVENLLLEGRGVTSQVALFLPGVQNDFLQTAEGVWMARGRNTAGELGFEGQALGTDTVLFTPVPYLSGATAVVSSQGSTFANFVDGTWAATGSNEAGQLGLGTTVNQTTFIPVPALAGAHSIQGTGGVTIAGLPDGSWVAAGSTWSGVLSTPSSVFVLIPELAGATQVLLTQSNLIARLADGTWIGKGTNAYSQLGLGDKLPRTAFEVIPGLAGAVQVAGEVSSNSTLARFPDGTWRAAGSSSYYFWPNGEPVPGFLPVAQLFGADKILHYGQNTWAHFPNGTWKAGGSNFFGQLGDGSAGGDNDIFTLILKDIPELYGASIVAPQEWTEFVVAKLADGRWIGTGKAYTNRGKQGWKDSKDWHLFSTLNP